MSEEECIHGLTPATCSICLHGISRPEKVTVEFTFAAKFDGECAECHLPTRAGERIAHLSTGAYVHPMCAP